MRAKTERRTGQASNVRSRVAVARQMHFQNEDVSGMTMQQFRGREGSRIRSVYRHTSKKAGIPWNGREYDPENFNDSDRSTWHFPPRTPAYMALSTASS